MKNPLVEFCLRRKIDYDPTCYDFVIVGDGSGLLTNKPCGFHAVILDVEKDCSWECGGSFTHGSGVAAELLAFYVAIEQVVDSRPGVLSRILCISDSQVTVYCAKGLWARTANLALWAAIDSYSQRKEVRLFWEHIERNTIESHAHCDERSKRWRVLTQNELWRFEQEQSREIPQKKKGNKNRRIPPIHRDKA